MLCRQYPKQQEKQSATSSPTSELEATKCLNETIDPNCGSGVTQCGTCASLTGGQSHVACPRVCNTFDLPYLLPIHAPAGDCQ